VIFGTLLLLENLNALNVRSTHVAIVSPVRNVSLSVCIPAILKDVRSGDLARTVGSIRYQTVQPDRVIIILTGVPTLKEAYARRTILKAAKGISLTLVIHATLQLQAESRNEGLSLSDTDVVTFFDADDVMHKSRLQIITQLFSDKDVSMVLHNYTTDFSGHDWMSIVDNVFVSDPQYVCNSEIRTRGRQIPLDILVHHAHISIRRADLQGLRYDVSPALHRFEDSVFVRKFLAQICPGPKKALFVGNQLSRYSS